jgi:hypothetical protein
VSFGVLEVIISSSQNYIVVLKSVVWRPAIASRLGAWQFLMSAWRFLSRDTHSETATTRRPHCDRVRVHLVGCQAVRLMMVLLLRHALLSSLAHIHSNDNFGTAFFPKNPMAAYMLHSVVLRDGNRLSFCFVSSRFVAKRRRCA